MANGGSIATRVVASPLGELVVAASEGGLRAVRFPPTDDVSAAGTASGNAARWLDHAERELHEYFHGRLKRFAVPLDMEGTEFQRRVWHELCRIEFGDAISYAELAKRVGSENGFRAVGGANGANKLAIIVPCHRVVSSDGTLGGYGGELWRKRWLLEHERRVAGLPPLDLFEMKMGETATGAAETAR
ncbi:MAG: methylated-DNA--[protein]-cysteine S-methyltransferase [Phycisphaerales bacterium]|nr:methylated-DNA--[protein]-cysteine S-methyltransferase [Phycisphaerales bacterium]